MSLRLPGSREPDLLRIEILEALELELRYELGAFVADVRLEVELRLKFLECLGDARDLGRALVLRAFLTHPVEGHGHHGRGGLGRHFARSGTNTGAGDLYDWHVELSSRVERTGIPRPGRGAALQRVRGGLGLRPAASAHAWKAHRWSRHVWGGRDGRPDLTGRWSLRPKVKAVNSLDSAALTGQPLRVP